MHQVSNLTTQAATFFRSLPAVSALPLAARVSIVATVALALFVAAYKTIKWAIALPLSPQDFTGLLPKTTESFTPPPARRDPQPHSDAKGTPATSSVLTASETAGIAAPAATYPETFTTTLRNKNGTKFMTGNNRAYEVVMRHKFAKWDIGVSITFSKDPSLLANQYICTNDRTKSKMTVKCLNILDDPSVDGPGASIR
jgi:hypothetical protein